MITENIIDFLKTFDWFLITSLIGFFVFIGSLVFVLFRLKRLRPGTIKPEKISLSESKDKTTYDWEIIKYIFTNCLLLAGGFFMISNVILYVVLREWYTDPVFLGAIAAIFGFYLLQTFDRFYRKLMK